MIISASRRTDIPTYYSDWFFNRIKEGFVFVRNPMNAHQISRIDLRPDVVDGIVFWTKNPLPMLDRLDLLKEYTYYFQFTLTSYGEDVESNIPSKSNVIIPSFQRLSDKLGPERVIWRYDPIFLSQKYSIDYHIHYFEMLAKRLSLYTKKCTISFLDYYRNTEKKLSTLGIQPFPIESQIFMAKKISEIAHSYGLSVDTCAEKIDLQNYGIQHAHCIDEKLFEKLLGCPLKIGKDKNQRMECGCIESIDIGVYNTCRNGCKYCYANYNNAAVSNNSSKHDVYSPILVGNIMPTDKISIRNMKSCQCGQLSFD